MSELEVGATRPRSPDLAELETLVACAAEGSMAGAAVLLGISRPAIAKRIRNLETIAGCPLLHRSGRGVALTDAGASLLASARRLLDDRDVLLEAVAKIRGEGTLAADGLRRLLSSSPAHARAAQQPEARLAEAEELLEHVLRASRTGLAISDPDTGEVLVVNDAFCEISGRSRAQLLGDPSASRELWDEHSARERIVEQARRSGAAEKARVGMRWPDGTLRTAEITARFITLGGTREVLWCLDDVTDEDDQAAPAAFRDGRLAASGDRLLAPLAPTPAAE